MKYLGAITNDYDLVTKKYVDDSKTYAVNNTRQQEASAVGWRKILGSSTGNTSGPEASIGTSCTGTIVYDNDGPAMNCSTGEVYTKGYKMYLDTSDDLYTAINNLGWVSSVIE